MKQITLYDVDAKTLERLAEEQDISVAELIETVIDVIKDAVDMTDYDQWRN